MKVINGNLEQALQVMQRKMVSSGMERLIRRAPTHHMKNSQKRILAEKNLQKRIRSEDLARKLRAILIKKVRYYRIVFVFSSIYDGILLFTVDIVRLGCMVAILSTRLIASSCSVSIRFLEDFTGSQLILQSHSDSSALLATHREVRTK